MKRILTVGVICIACTGLLFALRGHRTDIRQERLDAFISLSHGSSVKQAIRPVHNGIYEVELGDLVNKAVSRKDDEHEALEFRLYDDRGAVIRSLALSSRNIGDGSPLSLVFTPIPDSAGKRYLFELASLDATDSAKPVLSVGVSGKTLYFRTYYKNRMIVIVADSLRDFTKRFGSDPAFAVPYGLVLIILSLIFVRGKTTKSS